MSEEIQTAKPLNVFVIGATGYIGSHAARRLQRAGHRVTGFARSADNVAKLKAWGLEAFEGDLADLGPVCAAAQKADATLYVAQLMQPEENATLRALVAALEGSGKTLVFTSGTGVVGQRTAGDWSEDTFREDDPFTPPKQLQQRVDTENLTRAAQGMRGMVIRPPVIWGGEEGLKGHPAWIAMSAQKTGAACYVGAGLNMYSHVHVEDLADVYARALERGVAGALYHAVAGEVPNRWIAEVVARHLGVPTRSINIDEAIELWGKFSALFVLGASSRSRSPRTRSELGWSPERLDIIADAEEKLARMKAK